MEDFYKTNKKFKEYVDKYCKTYGYSKEQAFSHALIKEVMYSIKKEVGKRYERC